MLARQESMSRATLQLLIVAARKIVYINSFLFFLCVWRRSKLYYLFSVDDKL
jgi:hypothetical protein